MKNTIKILTILYLLLPQGLSLHAQSPTQILNQLNTPQANNRPDLIKQLSQQKAGDYSPQDKAQFQKILAADSLSHYDQLLRIAGQLGIGEEKLKALSSSSDDINIKTTAKLALARIGDQETLDKLMEKIKEVEVNDDFVYQYAPILVYVRQPDLSGMRRKTEEKEFIKCANAAIIRQRYGVPK